MEAGEEGNEFRVDEGAFWHTNMDLYYGYVPGEIVEVVHEPNKYWLATIEYCFKHLILLKWIGKHGEFWVDTSMPNALVNANSTFNEFNSPKRLFPLGYHLQSQLKSQFILEKPTKFLVKPSLYNPSKDPYAGIKTIDDLLAHEVDQTNDTFRINPSTNDNSDSASLVLAKCKTKIDYKPEDEEELAAALMNLDAIDNAGIDKCLAAQAVDSNYDHSKGEQVVKVSNDNVSDNDSITCVQDNGLGGTNQIKDSSITTQNYTEDSEPIDDSSDSDGSIVDVSHDEICFELCRDLQEISISRGYYFGIDPASMTYSDKVYFPKPKQFFDTGGANHERVFVPGTLLEVAWTMAEQSDSPVHELYWFAYVVKNIGGRLTLRWFFCDEPRFKQGRLEMKSCRSKYVKEIDTEVEAGEHKRDEKVYSEELEGKQTHLSSKEITFSLHFCDPRIHTITHGKSIDPENEYNYYLLPKIISQHLEECHNNESINSIRKTHLDNIFDIRRTNLDKDRPLIDHILSIVRSHSPNYLDLVFAPKDSKSDRQVLVSSSRMTKLIRGHVERETRPGLFEVKLDEFIREENVQFIYPLDSSYAVLPLDWADNHQDCLSVDPSTNPTPTLTENSTTPGNHEIDAVLTKVNEAEPCNDVQPPEIEQPTVDNKELCLKQSRFQVPKAGCSFTRLSDLEKSNIMEIHDCKDFDEFDPNCWSNILRKKELEANKFHCCIDTRLKCLVESRFKVMDQLEVVHPLSDTTICLGRIRKVVFPLIWIQISADCYTLLPFNSTNIYPTRWCETHGHPLVSLLPPRKRCIIQPSASQQSNGGKKRKKTSNKNNSNDVSPPEVDLIHVDDECYEKEHFDLYSIKSRQEDLDYMLNEKSKYVKIYFNHKCFTGPSLSKSKICSLPQYVGPGPLRLVLEEVVTKVISVAYVPPRILNDLSSASFGKLLYDRNLINVQLVEFKAKYQKRVYREEIPICVSADDVALYCECICEHIKCCYNLFGPELYDGDDCPGHCRALTKSNKFMKRATYYRDKARAGEFLTSNNNDQASKKSSNNDAGGDLSKTSRARYAGRGSSDSTASSCQSRSEHVTSRASSGGDDAAPNGLDIVEEVNDEENVDNGSGAVVKQTNGRESKPNGHEELIAPSSPIERDQELDKVFRSKDQEENIPSNTKIDKGQISAPELAALMDDSEFSRIESQVNHPDDWSLDEVGDILERCSLGRFKNLMETEGIDGQALMLLDKVAIKEHFQCHHSRTDFSIEELNKLCRFVEHVKAWANGLP